MVVEGAGGLMVPLTDTRTTLDLAQALNLPLLLVIGNRLGAINHALLTVEAARTRRLRVIGGVINHVSRGRDAAVRTNPRALQELVSCPRWATVPYADAADSVWETVAKRLDRAGFVEDLLEGTTR
jgi:dethiobiotin synthetase